MPRNYKSAPKKHWPCKAMEDALKERETANIKDKRYENKC